MSSIYKNYPFYKGLLPLKKLDINTGKVLFQKLLEKYFCEYKLFFEEYLTTSGERFFEPWEYKLSQENVKNETMGFNLPFLNFVGRKKNTNIKIVCHVACVSLFNSKFSHQKLDDNFIIVDFTKGYNKTEVFHLIGFDYLFGDFDIFNEEERKYEIQIKDVF